MKPSQPVSSHVDVDEVVAALRAERRRLRRLSLRLAVIAAGVYAVGHVAVVSTVIVACHTCDAPHIWLRW